MRRPGVSGNPDPNKDPKGGTSPGPALDPPDLGVELQTIPAVPGIPELHGCLTPAVQTQLRNALRSVFVGTFPDVDVRVACIDKHERIGVWTTRAANPDVEAARNASLGHLDLLVKSDTVIPLGFAVLLTQDFIGRMAHQAWVDLPKRYRLRDDGSTVADPKGTVYLQEFGFDLKRPDTIVTGIEGSASKPNSWVSWIDVHLDIEITDRLVVSGGRLLAHTHTKVNKSEDFLQKVFAILEAINFPVIIPDLVGGSGGAVSPQSIGGAIAALMPSEILIPGGDQRALFSYTSVAVSPAGVTAHGSVAIKARAPTIHLDQSDFDVEPGATTAFAQLRIVTHDLRAPLTVHWGSTTNRKLFETVEFAIKGKVGDVVSRPLLIEVIDVDGVKAKLHADMRFHIKAPTHSSPKNNPKGPDPEPKKIPTSPASARARKPRVAAK